jgi:YidC/Oxa1 family membrane protein insertase
MASLFNTILYQPFLNVLVLIWRYAAFKDFGVAIILLTIIIRLILFPIFQKSVRHQTLMQRLSPEIKKIQENHKGNKEKQAQAMMDLYRQHKVNPFGGFVLLIVQLPIMIGIYRVILKGFSPAIFTNLYSFVSAPSGFSQSFLGLIDLGGKSILIAVAAAVAQFFQGKLSLGKALKKEPGQNQKGADLAQMVSKQMIFIGPLFTIFIVGSLPSAIGLYWLTSTLFGIGQQIFINRQIKKQDERSSLKN